MAEELLRKFKSEDIAASQNGGTETYYEFENEKLADDRNVTEVYQKRRSYILATITEDSYNKIKVKITWLRYGDEEGINVRSGGLKVKVFQLGESIDFDRELVTIDDYKYPDKTICYSSVFTDDIISENLISENTYRLMGIDMIWCRQDTLFNRLSKILEE